MRIDELGLCESDYEKVDVNSTRWLNLVDFKNEIWRDVIGFEGLYEVSNYGRVKSLYNNIILKQGKNNNYYWLVILCKNGKKYTRKVHR